MNVLLFPPGALKAGGRLEVRGRPHEHIVSVLAAEKGDRLRVGEIGGLLGDGLIEDIEPKVTHLRCELHLQPPPKLPLILVLALPRPKMLRRILRGAAEFGVEKLILLNSYRVEKSFWQSPVLEASSLQQYCLQGLEQAGDTVLPEIQLRRRFKPFVEDELPGLLKNCEGLVAHPGDHAPCPRGPIAPTLVAIGPEGGWIPYEVEKLCGAGCHAVSLGPRTLRVEHAVLTLVGRLT